MILKTDCERCYDKEVKDTTYNNQILFNQTWQIDYKIFKNKFNLLKIREYLKKY